MLNRTLFIVVLLVLFAQIAFAQQFYKWKDEKRQWHFSDLPPAGVPAEKVKMGDTVRKPAQEPSVSSGGEDKKAEDGSDRPAQSISDADPLGSASRRLLVFPPSDIGAPLSEWTPVESFASVEECDRRRASEIAGSTRQSRERPRVLSDVVDFRALNSRCISLAEFKPSKEAHVIVALTTVERDPRGFSTLLLHGRVFNRGQTTARNVVVRYEVRDTSGTTYRKGEFPTSPKDIPPTMFAEFRGEIIGSRSLGDYRVHVEANWSKD